jgi:hypothetical protein
LAHWSKERVLAAEAAGGLMAVNANEVANVAIAATGAAIR